MVAAGAEAAGLAARRGPPGTAAAAPRPPLSALCFDYTAFHVQRNQRGTVTKAVAWLSGAAKKPLVVPFPTSVPLRALWPGDKLH